MLWLSYHLLSHIYYLMVILLGNISLLEESVFIDGILTFRIISIFSFMSVQVLFSS